MALELSTQDTPTPEQAARIQEVEQWNSSGLPALKATLREHANNGTLTPEREAAIMEIAEQKMGDVTSQLTSITSTSALAQEAARMKVDGLVDDDALRAAGIDQHFGQLAKKNYEQPMPEYLAEGAKNVGLGLAKEALAFTPVAPIARLLTGDPTTLQSNIVVPIVKGLGGAAYDVAASPFSEAARQRLPAEIEAGARMTADLASQAFTRGMYSDAAKRGDFSPLLFAEMARYEDSQKALAGQGALSKAAGAAGLVDASKPFSPETRKKVEERSVAFDPMNYTPAGAVEAVAGKSALLAAKGLSKVPAGASFVEKAAQLGVRAATGAAKILDTTPKNLAAARGLQTLEQAAKATEAKGVGLFTAAPVAGEKLVQVGKQMKAHALDVSRVAAAPTISGAALTIGATLAGADLGTSLVAGLVATGVGKAAQRRLGTAALGQATEMAGHLLVGTKTSRAALQMLDDYRFAKSALVGAGVGAAAGVPFALLSNDPEEQAAILTAGGALGSAHSVARTGKAFLNGVTLRAAGMGPKGEQAPKNLPLTPYGSSPVADSLHSKADTMLSNAGADFVGSLRETLGDRAEFYAAASPEDANAIAASMGVKLPEGNWQGVCFVRPSDKKPIAISLVGKESGGHETTHALLKAIEADPTTADAYDAAYRAADKALGAEGSKTFDSLKREYETLHGAPVENLVRSTDRGVVRDYLINEVLAEHGSVLLAGLPSGKLGGDPTVTQRVVRGLLKFGENLNLRNVMSGDRSVTTSKTLKYNPQFNLLDALSNVVDAVKLENSKEVAHIVDEAKRTPSTQDDLSAEGILNPIPKSLYEDANYDPTSPTILAETEPGKVPFGSEDNPLSEYDAAKSSGRVIFPKPAEGVVPEAAPVSPAPEVAPTRVVTASDGTVIGTDAAQVGPVRVSRDGKRFAEVEYKAADGTQKKSFVPEENFAGEDASPAAFDGEPVAPGTVPQIRSTPEGRAALAGAGAAPRVSSTTPENVRTLVEQHAQTPYSERKVLRADYDSAVKPSEGDPTRDVRAEQLQRASKLDALGLKNPLREAADKAFIPTTAGKSSKGFYAYNLDKVAANLDRVAIWGTENPEYFKALKTGYDSPTSPEILADHQNYQKNQANGYAGDGRKLAQVSTEGGTAEPLPVTPGYVPVKLPKERAQFLNMLMGTYGKGRSAVKSFPDVFSTRLAEAMGVGVHLAEGETATGGPKLTVEANAMAKKLESLGFDPRDLETAFEQLKYDRFLSQPEVIKGATLAPAYEQVVQAGLMPAHATESPDFKKWSKGVKVIKRDDVKNYDFQTGKPFVAETVHGTGAKVGIDPATGMQKEFDAFDLSRGGEKTGAASAQMAVFSTDNPDVAATYASNIGPGGALKLALKGPEDSVKSTPRFQSLQKDYDAAREATTAAYKAQAADVRKTFDRDYASKPGIEELLKMFMEQSSREESLNRIFGVLADGIKPSEEAVKRVADASAAEDRAGEALGAYIYDSESSALPQRLIPLAVRMDNPKVFDAQGATPADFKLSERMAQAKAEGHDGVVFRNLRDPDLPATHFASFNPENLKSTISPTFDPANPAAFMPAGKIDSPEFKTWFGDLGDPKAYTSRAKGPVSFASKLENGKLVPKRLLHATRNDFNSFEVGRNTVNSNVFGDELTQRHAIFLTDSPDLSNQYVTSSSGKVAEGARTIPLYASVKSPLDLTKSFDAYALGEELGVSGRWIQNIGDHWQLFDGEDGKAFVDGAKKAGYDGVIFSETGPDRLSDHEVYAVFSPEQVKSAISPTFDAANPAAFMPEHSPEGAQYTDSVLSKLRAVTREGSNGDTFNQDGTQYTGGGLVVPLVSQNFDRNAIKIGDIQAFKDANADKMSPAVKVGVYKFPNSEDMSVDLNIVVDPKHEALARRVGADLGQESLFDLGSFENVKTGASGKSTLPLTPEQFKRLGDALSKGEYPQDVITEAYAQHPEIAKAIQAEIAPAKNYPDSVEGQTMRANDAADLALPKEQGTADVAMMPEGPLSSETVKGKNVQFRRAKPIDGAVGGVLELVHFSSKDVKEIDPKKSFGKGAAQTEDRKGLNKAFFYTKGTSYEHNIATRQNIYEAKVDGNSIYDYNADSLGVRGIVNRIHREQAIMDAGFVGYYSETPGFNAVAMFEPTKLKPTDAESVMNRRQLIDTGRAESTPADEKAFAKQDAQIARDEANAEKTRAKTETAVKKSPEYKAEYKRLVASDKYVEGSFFFDQQMDNWVGEQVDKRISGSGSPTLSENAGEGRPFSPEIRDLLQRRKNGEKISQAQFDEAVNATFPSTLVPVPTFESLPVENPVYSKGSSSELRYMPAEKGPLSEAKLGPILKAGDADTLPVFQQLNDKGQPAIKSKKPLIAAQKYAFLDSPALKDYAGPSPEDLTIPDFDALPYHVTGPSRIALEKAIKSGAIDDASNRLVSEITGALQNIEIASGKGWYSRMRDHLKRALGEDGRETFSQLLGATSARTPVDENFMQAYDAFRKLQDGSYDKIREGYLKLKMAKENGNLAEHVKSTGAEQVVKSDIGVLEKKISKLEGSKRLAARKQINALKKIINIPKGDRTDAQWMSIDILGSRLTPTRSNGKKFNANSLAVLKVISGTWLSEATAPKTPNFAGNLTGRTLQATIDVWAARSLRDLLYSVGKEPWRIQPGAEIPVGNADFAVGQEIFKRAAKKLDMNPDDLQAIAWFNEKDKWEKKGWTKSETAASKSSFDDAFHIFFPEGERPRSFKEAQKIIRDERAARKARGEAKLPLQDA